MNELNCFRCNRRLTIYEAAGPSYVVHEYGEPHRWCGVCCYRYADPEDYGKPKLLKRLYIMWQRYWTPKAEDPDD